jgi:hypothetical protein
VRKYATAALLALILGVSGAALAQEHGHGQGHKGEPDAHAKRAALDHRAMAEAHLSAAKCLEAGTAEKACHAQLAKDCKGLGIGRYCGMRHRH